MSINSAPYFSIENAQKLMSESSLAINSSLESITKPESKADSAILLTPESRITISPRTEQQIATRDVTQYKRRWCCRNERRGLFGFVLQYVSLLLLDSFLCSLRIWKINEYHEDFTNDMFLFFQI